MSAPVEIERVRLVHAAPGFAFADVRMRDVHLCGLKVRQRPNGALEVSPPTIADRNGKEWPCFALQPGAREAVEAAIAALWHTSRSKIP